MSGASERKALGRSGTGTKQEGGALWDKAREAALRPSVKGWTLGPSMRGSSEAEREGVVDSGAKHEGSDPGTKATGCVGDVCGSWVHWFQVVCGVVVHCVVRYKSNLTLA